MPGVRSITIEDIEAKDVLNITDAKKIELTGSYGYTYRYYFKGDEETGKIYYQDLDYNKTDTEEDDTMEEGWSSEKGGTYNIFISYDKVIDGTEENKNNVVKIKQKYYDEYPNAFVDTKFEDSLGTGEYWLASQCINCSNSAANFDIRNIKNGNISYECMFTSKGTAPTSESGVRAVIYI